MSNQNLKRAAKTASALAVLVSVQRNDVHHEVDRVTFAGLPLFERDEKGNPKLFGIFKMRRRRGPRAE
jgi:hypothetical protein